MAKAKDPPGIPPGKTYDGLSYLTCDTIGDLDHGLAVDERPKAEAK